MNAKPVVPWGLRAIMVFYAIGVVIAAIAALTNRDAVGLQLALVHGLPALAGLPGIVLAITLGVLVVVGLNSMRPWGYWATVAYMVYLLVVPPLTLGADHVSLFANVLWPLFMLAYLAPKRHSLGIGSARQRLTSESS